MLSRLKVEVKRKKPARLTDAQIRAHLEATSVYFVDGQPVTQAHVDAARSCMDRGARGVKVRQLLPGDYD